MSSAARHIGIDQSGIRTFEIHVPEADLADLRRRVSAARLPDRETVTDFSQGVPLATVQKLARYWATEYDWRRCEVRLNAAPNFLTEIDGLDIHFIHARSKHENALPIILTHGWPGSIVWFLKVIEPLTNPTAHGGSAADAFHVVVPSLPGYGFSGKPVDAGWGPARIARAWTALMARLGYERYVAQGGDWGAIITELMGADAPKGLAGIHTNMANVVPPEIDRVLWAGGPLPEEGLSEDERRACEQLVLVYQRVHYALYMGSRPQTLAALADSPVGLATFLLDLEPDVRGLELLCRVFDGAREGLTRDDVLDNATLYWLTNTGVSAARIYWENKLSFFAPKKVEIPVAVSVFPDEFYHAPRSWAERAYPKLVHFHKTAKGGHYPAWDEPGTFVEELRTGFRAVRE